MNLISHDLVIVHPMSAMSGYINYIEYSTSVDKGQSKDRFISSPFGYGDVDANYTSSKVVDEATLVAADAGKIAFGWKPVVEGTVDVTVGANRYVDGGDGRIYLVDNTTRITKRMVAEEVDENGVASGIPAHIEVNFTGTHTDAGAIIYDGDNAGIEFTNTTLEGAYTLRYTYNNIVVPQNKLPMIKAEVKSIALVAKARRIAIYYSQIAAFQANQDYGYNLPNQLQEKAVGELEYEIDTEVTQLLIDNAREDAELVWSKTLPVGVNA